MRKHMIDHVINVSLLWPQLAPQVAGYSHYPFPDTVPSTETIQILETVADELNSLVANGKNTLVHCNMGISRSVAAVVRYLMKYRRLSYELAIHTIRLNRPCANPNRGLVALLREVESDLEIVIEL